MKNIAPYRSLHPGTQPDYLHHPYASSVLRSPRKPLVSIPQTLSELTGPNADGGYSVVSSDLTRISGGEEAQGQRIVVSGRVLDENARPVRNALLEIWQANAAGRYFHRLDQHNAPLDPNFTGVGQTLTDDNGNYRFITILPGRYPWGNHYNAWRPAHIHFSLFGSSVATRLVTQMYFPGDPMLECDPIFNCVVDPIARRNLISTMDWETTIPNEAIGYRFDIILRGRDATPMETNHR